VWESTTECSASGHELGLCVHPASVDSRLTHTRRVFDSSAGSRAHRTVRPEQGYGGEAQGHDSA
jgi:hypothetical protein